MSERIVVVNPNSTTAVTAAIDRALEPLRMTGGPAIECLTLAEGPPRIETPRRTSSRWCSRFAGSCGRARTPAPS